jgi:hypothetical protein
MAYLEVFMQSVISDVWTLITNYLLNKKLCMCTATISPPNAPTPLLVLLLAHQIGARFAALIHNLH